MIRLELPLDLFHRQLIEPATGMGQQIRQTGELAVVSMDDNTPPPPLAKGGNELSPPLAKEGGDALPPLGKGGIGGVKRSQTWLIVSKQFLLLVDTFHSAQSEPYRLALPSLVPIERIGHAYVTHDGLHLHPLGDYFPLDHHPFQLIFTQRFIQGRFLLAVSRDPEARFRVLNGWSIEARLPGRVYHLLHSNHSRKLRPLGPIRTDALYGVANWTPVPDSVERTGFEASLALVQAGQIEWSETRKESIQPPADVVYRIA